MNFNGRDRSRRRWAVATLILCSFCWKESVRAQELKLSSEPDSVGTVQDHEQKVRAGDFTAPAPESQRAAARLAMARGEWAVAAAAWERMDK